LHFRFDFWKALQAAGVLLDADDGCMEYIRLLKLLYVVDRELLAETGRTLTGDKAYAMDHGPVLSRVYSTIKGETPDAGSWSDFVHRDGYKVELRKDPGRGRLSKREVAKLLDVADRYRNMTEWEIVRQTHEFSEWAKHYVQGTSTPIPWDDALRAVGRDDMIPIAEKEVATRRAVDELFGG